MTTATEKKPAEELTNEWQIVTGERIGDMYHTLTHRLKVPGGWLYRMSTYAPPFDPGDYADDVDGSPLPHSSVTTFVPDNPK